MEGETTNGVRWMSPQMRIAYIALQRLKKLNEPMLLSRKRVSAKVLVVITNFVLPISTYTPPPLHLNWKIRCSAGGESDPHVSSWT